MTQSTIKRLERLIRYYRQNVFNIDDTIADYMHHQLMRAKQLLSPVYKKHADDMDYRYSERLLRMYA